MWLFVAVVVAAAGTICFAQTTAPAAEQRPESMSFLELLLKGRRFMIPIGLCSLMGWAVIIERLIALRRGAVIPPSFLPDLKAAFSHSSKDRTPGLNYCRERDCPISRVVQAAIRKLHRSEEAVERAIEDAGGNEISKLRRNLRMLWGPQARTTPMAGG